MTDDDLFRKAVRALTTPLDWRTVPAADAEQRWQTLRDWVCWLTDRYSLDHRVVPPCWYLHPALVDLLTALADHHRVSFDPYASPAGAADWHIMFTTLEARLREWAARTGCTRDLHRPDITIDPTDDTNRWQAHVAADRSAREQHELAPPPEDDR